MARARTLFASEGQRFGRGVVIDPEVRIPLRSNRLGRRGARLRCDCGNVYESALTPLVSGLTTSCGCAQREAARKAGLATWQIAQAVRLAKAKSPSGMSGHYLMATWYGILARCENPHSKSYRWYGARGIKVCERWRDAKLFIADIEQQLGARPEDHSLERIDNDGHYEPGNVKWASRSEQQRNKRSANDPVKEVCRLNGDWVAHVCLGRFSSEEEAATVHARAVDLLTREGVIQ